MRWTALIVLVAAASIVMAQEGKNLAPPPTLGANSPPPIVEGRFEFEVIESYDAKYLGDTPGHIGRHGELGKFRPQAALGDPVFRGEKQVGKITGLRWSQPHESLEVEFDPEPLERIAVGDLVWIQLGEKKSDR